MATLATLTIDLVGRSSKLTAELKKSTQNTKSWAEQTKADVAKVSNSFKLMGGLAATGLASLSLSQNRAQELENLSRIANTSVDEFLNYALAAKTVGIETEKLADISKDTLEKLGEYIATGGGGFKDFFEQVAPKVGLTAKELQNLSGPDVLIAVKTAMDKANISAEKQSFYLESIASDTTNLIPLLKNQGESFKKVSADSLTLTQSFAHFGDVAAKVITDMDQKSGITSGLSSWIIEISARLEAANTGIDSVASLEAKHNDLMNAIESRRLKGMPVDDLQDRLIEVNEQLEFLKNSYISNVNEMFSGTEIAPKGQEVLTTKLIEQIESTQAELQAKTDGLTFDGLDFNLFPDSGSWEDELQIPGFQSALDQIQDYSDKPFEFMEIPEIDWNAKLNLTGLQTTTETAKTFWESYAESIRNTAENTDQLWANTLTNFSQNVSQNVTDSIFEWEGFGKLTENIALSFGKSMVAALVDIGTQRLTLWALEKVIGKSTNVSYATQVAAQAQAGSHLAAINAFSSTAAIPIVGPGLAPSAAALAEAATQPLAAAATASAVSSIASFEGGGYIKDGPRTGGVDGRGGKYAVLHPDESVIDHKKNQSIGTNVVINVIEDASKAGTQSKEQGPTDEHIINVFVSNIHDGGDAGTIIENTFGVSRVGV